MPKQTKPRGRPFPKGEISGPGKAGPGRPPIHPELKATEPLGKENVLRLIAKLWETPIEELQVMSESLWVPAGRAIMAKILVMAHQHGDHQRINFILDRTIGKVQDKLEVSSKPFIVEKLDGSQVVMGTAIEGAADVNAVAG